MKCNRDFQKSGWQSDTNVYDGNDDYRDGDYRDDDGNDDETSLFVYLVV
jgi:hypothetical protein